MVQLLRATLCLAALAGAAASVGELHTKSFIKRKNWPKPAGPGSLPGLAWGKLKLDLGKVCATALHADLLARDSPT